MLPHWEFLASCYAGGRQWFADNIFRYIKEGDKEFKNRVVRAYRFNHTREIVDLVTKYIFKAKVIRNTEDASDAVKAFWKIATLTGGDIGTYMRYVSDKTSTFGRVWVVVDSNKSGTALSLADDKQEGAQIYSYVVTPQHVMDMSHDERGNLNWILIHEIHREDEDPFESSGAEVSRYRLWMKNEWFLFEVTGKGRNQKVELIDTGIHNLGVVPVFHADNISADESPYSAPALIGDIAYLDRAIANYLSNLDAIIQDQTFSQLALPAQGLLPGEESHTKLIEMGTKRIFTYDGEGGSKPEYLSPDPKQAMLIITAVKQIINEVYHTVGMAGERTKQDNSAGIDNSSGVAKAYDFERVNSLLVSKAASLDTVENNLIRLVNLWSSQSNKSDTDLVKYPEDFDTRGLYDEFDIAGKLAAIDAPDLVRQTQMDVLIEKLFPRLSEKTKEEIKGQMKEWPPKQEMNIPIPAKKTTDQKITPKS